MEIAILLVWIMILIIIIICQKQVIRKYSAEWSAYEEREKYLRDLISKQDI